MATEDYCYSASDEDYESDYTIDEDDDELDHLAVDSAAADGNRSTVSVINAESLLAAQKEELQKVMDLLAIKEYQARTLLTFYRWNLERLYESFDWKGKEKLCQEAGVSLTITDNSVIDMLNTTCEVCFEDLSADAITRMDCGHYFCNECWIENFVVKIQDGESRIRCMTPKCNSICDDAVVRSLLCRKDKSISDRFDRSLLMSYVEDNDFVKWCPSLPHCGNAIRLEINDAYEVECRCGVQFCFNCLQEAHSPCSCQMWKLWIKKCKDESGSVDWILVNTKPCPKCHKSVHKDGGCNLVTCKCGQHFCWLCGGATGFAHTYHTISGHKCNKFDDKTVISVESAKRRLDRYIHHYNRYKVHTDSLKRDSALREKIQATISNLESEDFSGKDYSWVLVAFERLLLSRTFLSYSYPFSFFMFGDDLPENRLTPEEKQMKQNLFDDQQLLLERNVERLSMFFEIKMEDFHEDRVMETMNRVVDLSKILEKCCRQIYNWIDDELLEFLEPIVHRMAPYSSRGPTRALEFSTSSIHST